MNSKNTPEVFWSRVKKGDECWEWTARLTASGYGRLRWAGEWMFAHRLSYQLTFGQIEPGMCICHHCDNPKCVRPDHLFMGTHKDNAQDKVRKGRQRRIVGNWKVTPDQVRNIRDLAAVGGITFQQIGARFGVSRSAVWLMVHRKTWGSVV